MAIVDRIEIDNKMANIQIDRVGLADVLGVAIPTDALATQSPHIVLLIDYDLKPSSHGAKIIMSSDQPDVDRDLIALVRQAIQAREALVTECHDSIEALSEELRITKAKATNPLRLSWLALILVNAILDGDQLPKLCSLPQKTCQNDWFKQVEFLGISTH